MSNTVITSGGVSETMDYGVEKVRSLFHCTPFHIIVLQSEEDGVKCLEMDETEEIWKNLSEWQQILNLQSEQFSGEVLLQRQEDLKSIRTVISQWTEVSLALVWRHHHANSKKQPQEEGKEEEGEKEENQPDESLNQQSVMSILDHIDVFMKQLATRSSGENGKLRVRSINVRTLTYHTHSGVAVGYVHLITPMETW